MKIRYFLGKTSKPINERTDNELVYAEVSNRFGTSINGKVTYSQFQYSLETYVKPQHFGILKEKRGSINFVYDVATIDKHKQHTGDLMQSILNFDKSVNQTMLYFRNAGKKPNKEEFKARLHLFTMRDNGIKDTVTLEKYITERIAYFNSIMGTGEARVIKKDTLENYSNLLKVIQNYNEVKKTDVTFENLKSVYKDLWNVQDSIIKGNIKLSIKEGEAKKPINKHGIATNTIVTYQSCLRQICNDAISEGIEVSLSVTDKNLIHSVQKSSRQYDINNKDLLTIYNHNPTTERLQKAKDYIIFSSLAGMRFQSVLELVGNPIQSYNRNGIKFDYVHTIQAKTQTECHTPLFEPAKEVIIRNGGKLPNFSKYTGTINKQIKDLFKEAGLTYELPVTKHYLNDGAITIYESVAKIVSSHCTRRGFTTNLYKFGVDETTSDLVTHPDKKRAGTADNYNKITNETRALRFYAEVTKNLTDNVLYRF